MPHPNRVTPLGTLIATPAIGRAVMGSLFNAVLHADGGGLRQRVLFELDEGSILGDMAEIMLMYATGRKYGAVMQMMLQSDFQLTEAWGRDRAAVLRNCCSWMSYNSIQDFDTAKRLSDTLDTHGVKASSTGHNQGTSAQWGTLTPNVSKGSVESLHEIKRALISPGEIMRAPSDRMWVTALGKPYIAQCAAAPFYHYPAIRNRMDNSRFNYTQQKG